MVKCSECGFLASRNVQTRQLEETEPEIRLEGDLSRVWNTEKPTNVYEPPICFMQVPDFQVIPYTTQYALQFGEEERKKIRSEIQRERDCEHFTKWHMGFTPKEHREMLDRMAMLKWQTEREGADRRWRQSESRKNRRWRFWEFVVAVIAVIVIVVAAIVGAIIERGGQPTINIITTNPENIAIEQEP